MLALVIVRAVKNGAALQGREFAEHSVLQEDRRDRTDDQTVDMPAVDGSEAIVPMSYRSFEIWQAVGRLLRNCVLLIGSITSRLSLVRMIIRAYEDIAHTLCDKFLPYAYGTAYMQSRAQGGIPIRDHTFMLAMETNKNTPISTRLQYHTISQSRTNW